MSHGFLVFSSWPACESRAGSFSASASGGSSAGYASPEADKAGMLKQETPIKTRSVNLIAKAATDHCSDVMKGNPSYQIQRVIDA
jgi:hypothetical protein